MLFYKNKASNDSTYSRIENSFSTFCVTASLDVEIYVTRAVGFNFNVGRNYSIDLPLTQVMGGLILRIGKKPPRPPPFLAFNVPSVE